MHGILPLPPMWYHDKTIVTSVIVISQTAMTNETTERSKFKDQLHHRQTATVSTAATLGQKRQTQACILYKMVITMYMLSTPINWKMGNNAKWHVLTTWMYIFVNTSYKWLELLHNISAMILHAFSYNGFYSVKRQETGYLLGPASTRSEAIPERNMSPLACAVMRFILHTCFMWAACHQPEVREGISQCQY